MLISSSPISRYSEAATLGYVVYLLSGTSRTSLNLISLQTWLHAPIRLDQILVVFGENGVAIGYITWAYVTDETAARLGDGSRCPPLPEDWNDGALLWIVDVVAPFGHFTAIARAAREHFGMRYSQFAYASRRDGLVRLRSASPRINAVKLD